MIFNILSGILHLGNIDLILVNGHVQIGNREEFNLCSTLLNLQVDELKELIIPLDHKSDLTFCQNIKNELAMILYKMVCDWVIVKINQNLQKSSNFQTSQPFISIFECYGYNPINNHQNIVNFTINSVNEKIKQLFCTSIFKYYSVTIKNNDLMIEFIQNFQNKLIELFNCSDKDKLNSNENFIEEISKLVNSNVTIQKDDSNPDSNEILLSCNHFFRRTYYSISQFYNLITTMDQKTLNHINLLVRNSIISNLVCNDSGFSFCFPKVTCSFYFDHILNDCVHIIDSTQPHFICCIRTDYNNEPFADSFVLRQLKVHGITQLIGTQNRKPKISRSDITQEVDKKFIDEIDNSSSKSSKKHRRARSATSSHSVLSSFKKKSMTRSNTAATNTNTSKKINIEPLSFLDDPNDFTLTPKSPKTPISARLRSSPRKFVQINEDPIPNSDFIDFLINEDIDNEFDLSSDELSSISSLSSLEDEDFTLSDPNCNNNSIIKTRSYSDPSRLKRIRKIKRNSENNTDSNITIDSSNLTLKKRAEEFLFLYSCGSLLRTIYKEEQTTTSSIQQILSPHRISDANVVMNYHQQVRRSNSATEVDSEPVPLYGNTKSDGIINSDKDDVFDEWKGLEQAEITPELVNWERKSLRIRKDVNLLPLLKFDTGDAVINQINYHNPIKTTPRRHKSIM